MKWLLFILLLPCTVHAQKYDLTLGGGISSNSFNSMISRDPTYSGHKTINPAAMLRIKRNITPHIQAGMQISAANFTYKEQIVVTTFPSGTQTWDITNVIANPAISALLVGDYSLFGFYGGMGIGYLFPVTRETKVSNSGAAKFYEYSHTNGAPVFNLHAGYKKKLAAGFSLDICASYNTCALSHTKTFDGGTINFYNLLIGISKKIGK